MMTAAAFELSERNRLLAALLPADFALLAPDLKDMHFSSTKPGTELSRFISHAAE
jgi:hypothetical protein